jgi:hypothetical protein
MKIVSEFKDYYDYLAHQYGVDETIVFNRKPIPNNDETKLILTQLHNLSVINGNRFVNDKLYTIGENKSRYRWLSVNGVLYLLYTGKPKCTNLEFKVFTREQYDEFFPKFKYDLFNRNRSYENLVGNNKNVKELTAIHIKLNTPIFWFDHTGFGDFLSVGNSDVSRFKLPILSEIGFASIYPADKLFQDISYFIGNVMKDSPDVKPPVEIEDKHKIVGHGFDLKQSFRHRK